MSNDIKLYEENASFIIKIPKEMLKLVRHEPFLLFSGDVLEVGDMFTEIKSSGSAGNLPIILTPPWVQRYQGKIKLENSYCSLPSCWEGRDFILFDALNTEDESEGFLSPGKAAEWTGTKSIDDGYYLGYLDHYQNSLFYPRSRNGCSYTICRCIGIERYNPDELCAV